VEPTTKTMWCGTTNGIRTADKRAKPGRALFYTRDSCGIHENTSVEFVRENPAIRWGLCGIGLLLALITAFLIFVVTMIRHSFAGQGTEEAEGVETGLADIVAIVGTWQAKFERHGVGVRGGSRP
jgi:hypothetical protein